MRAVINIDSAASTPIRRQIYNAWRRGILAGRFARGERVPSTRELADALSVSRSTVTQAYEQLVAEGYLQSNHGSGTFVCKELPDSQLRAKNLSKARGSKTPAVTLSRYGAGLQEDYSVPLRRAGFINFASWGPDREVFPFSFWRRVLLRHMRTASADMFQYAERAAGYRPLREEIAKYLRRSRAVHCEAEQIVVVNGSQQGLDLTARLLLDPGDEMVIENPCYLGASRVFKASGAQLRAVAVDAEGITTRDLGARARLVHVTPSHQFPSGVAMSLNRRLELLAWARQHNATIVEDDYDSEYRYGGPPLPALQGLVDDVPVVYCGTFSKVMFPGLRIGYLVVPQSLVAPFMRAKFLADRHTAILDQMALRDFLAEGHLERHIRRMRRLYGARREALLESLRRHFGDAAVVVGDAAGMHTMVRIDDKTLGERALQNKVQLRNAASSYLGRAPSNEYLFGFSMINERTIREGIKRIAP